MMLNLQVTYGFWLQAVRRGGRLQDVPYLF